MQVKFDLSSSWLLLTVELTVELAQYLAGQIVKSQFRYMVVCCQLLAKFQIASGDGKIGKI